MKGQIPIIDEIYNYRQGSLSAVKVSEKWETLCIRFEKILIEEQLTMFHKLSATSADEARTAYKAGFKDGATVMIDIMA